MARFQDVWVQAAREWLLTQWVASERLVLYSVIDGAATERLHMERVAREYLGSYPPNRQSDDGVASFSEAGVQAAREWLYSRWAAASEQLH